jgi:hypothetical protein
MRYAVTDIAGPYIAGQRVSAGKILDLDPATVAYEIDQGWLVPAAAAVASPENEDGSANPQRRR